MVLASRIIACLDVDGGRVVKGVNFVSLQEAGNPIVLAERYDAQGADELCFLDIGATAEGRDSMYDVVRQTAERISIPFTVGGGIRSAADVKKMLRTGADKVSLNSAAVRNPEVLSEAGDAFGAQCVVCAIDAKWRPGGYEVVIDGGRTPTDLDAVKWAIDAVSRGAGEILLTSMDKDGTQDGYDLGLTKTVSEAVGVPVIASGGAGKASHLIDAITEGRADAVLVASIVHYGQTTVGDLKKELAEAGICVRMNY